MSLSQRKRDALRAVASHGGSENECVIASKILEDLENIELSQVKERLFSMILGIVFAVVMA